MNMLRFPAMAILAPIIAWSAASAQSIPCSDISAVFTVVEEMPEFPGGQTELFRYLGKSLKAPMEEEDDRPSSRKQMSFTVQRDGRVCDVLIPRTNDRVWVAEMERTLSSMPNWKPGRQHGDPVNVRVSLPLIICLK